MEKRRNILEICIPCVESALAAQAGGADRIELCSALEIGGVTPSHGLIARVRRLLKIDVFVLIRPRAGDFVYTPAELDVIREDIEFCKRTGVQGVVLGVLTPSGDVNYEVTRELVAIAKPMEVTFHRAFDLVSNPFQAMEKIVQAGCQRILTSGLHNTAYKGKGLIAEFVEKAKDDIIIMPGSGINEHNILEIRDVTGAREFHLSAKTPVPTSLPFDLSESNGDLAGMLQWEQSDREIVEKIVRILA